MTAAVPPEVEELLRTSVDIAVRAPGRANLFGEHTDYNEGFVLPIAIEPACFIVGRADDVIRLSSRELDDPITIDPLSGRGEVNGWGRYVVAVVKALNDADIPLRGIDGTVTSTLPIGAGLGSSAALEVALVRALSTRELDPIDTAHACRRAENNYVGVRSGIMDPLVSAAARPHHACLIDCRSNEIEYIRIPDAIRFVIIDSGVERNLAASGYNERRAECERAAEQLGVTSLRDVSPMELPSARETLDERAYRRVRHVVSENERVHAAADALRREAMDELGQLFTGSYRSYAEDFEASTPEIDRLVALARATPGVIGSRLTGGGWGGCTISIAHADVAEEAARSVAESFGKETGRPVRWWVTGASEGAARIL